MSLSESPPNARWTRPQLLLLLAFILIEATGTFEQVMMYAAIPFLMQEFQMDAAQLGWTVTVFLLVGAGTAALVTRLADMYGRKRVLLILMTISAVGSFISFAFATYEAILVGRALQGTSAALFPILIAVARDALPPRRVPVAVATVTGTAIIAGGLGVFIGGVIIDGGTWRYTFLASGLLALLSIAFALKVLPRSVQAVRDGSRVDWVGGALLAPAVAAILYGVTSAESDGWGSATVLGFVLGGIAVAIAWAVFELRISSPMFNLRLFKSRPVLLCLFLGAFVSVGSQAGGGLLVPILMQSPSMLPVGLGLTATVAGAYGLIGATAGFGLSPFSGQIAGKYGAKVVLSLGIVVSGVGFLMLMLLFDNLALVVVGASITSIGGCLVLAGLPNLIVESVPAESTGEAIALVYSVTQKIFVAVGTSVLTLLLASSVVPKTTAPTKDAWQLTIGFVFVTLVGALIATLLVRKTKPMDERAQAAPAESSPPSVDSQPVGASI